MTPSTSLAQLEENDHANQIANIVRAAPPQKALTTQGIFGSNRMNPAARAVATAQTGSSWSASTSGVAAPAIAAAPS